MTNGHPERDAELRAALARLPERQRTAVFLRYYADLDYAAIGEALGIADRDRRGDPQRSAYCAPQPSRGGTNVTELDRDSLDRILPRAPGPADWDDVLRRSGARRGRRRAGLVALVVAALVVAGTASALATVRAFFLGTGVNSKIAFMHNTRKNCCPHELWIMNADGSKPQRVARDVESSYSWSPDRRLFAYSRIRRGHGHDIYVVRADGSG